MVRPQIRNYNYDPNHQHKPIDTIRDFEYYTMHIIKNGEKKPRRLVFGDVTWTDNIDTLGMELRTSLPKNVQDRFLRYYNVAEIGDMIIFKNLDHVIFQGMIYDLVDNRHSKDITCFDFGYYLNKTKILKQFNKMNGASAIKEVCSAIGFPVGKVDSMSVSITEVYNNQTPGDIIKDIIEKEKNASGKDYRMEVREGKLYVEQHSNLKIKLWHKPAANVSIFDPTLVPGEITRDESISDMANEVIVTMNDKKKVKTVATARDAESIKKYGKMTHYESINKDDAKNAQKIANNKLRELTGIKTNLTVELLGDDKARSGRVITLNNETFRLKGDYLILNCEQTLKNSNRTMKLDIRGV